MTTHHKKKFNSAFSLLVLMLCLNQLVAQDNIALLQFKKNKLKQAKNIQDEVQILSELNLLYNNLLSEKYEVAKLLYDKAISLPKKNDSIIAAALLNKGWCENYSGEYSKATNSLHEAAALFLKNKDSLNYFVTLSELSITQRRAFNYREAENHAILAYQYFLRNNILQKTSIAAYNVASVYMDLDENDKGLYYGQQALKYAQQLKNAHDQGFAYMIIGRVNDKLNDDKPAEQNYLLAENALQNTTWCIPKGINYFYLIQFYNKRQEFNKSLYYLDLIMKNDLCLGHSIEKSMVFKTWMQTLIFEKSGQYDKATLYAEQYLALIDSSLKSKSEHSSYELKGLPKVLIPYARSLFKSGKIDIAKKEVEYALDISKKYGRKTEIEEEYELLSKISKELGDLENALTFEKYRALYHDSLIQENRIKEISRLQAVFDTENLKKEKNILAHENEVKSMKLNQNKILFAIFSISLLVISILIYLILQRKKLKSERNKIEIEQRFLLSQLNPHFIFNSLSSIQNFIVSRDHIEAGSYLAKFSRLMRNILENSREEYIPLENEINTIKYYIELQQLRFNHSFSYSIQINEDIESHVLSVPPMFLQPFIENSIEHGFSGKVREWKIEINAKRINTNYIQFEITDNGIGRRKAEDQKKNDFSSHKSLATKITSERIAFLKQQKHTYSSIEIFDLQNNEGTKVTITLPYIEMI
ncbi:MAG: sensor histidine kinase [Flavobacteriales bacterium]